MLMKRIAAAVLSVLLTLFILPPITASQTADVVGQADFTTYSEAYVVIDAATGQVLLEQNMNKRMYPASITKVLTVAVALERAALSDKLVMSEAAVSSVARSSSHIALTADEEISVKDAVMATMLASANDAANGIAEHIGGSAEMFCAIMNKTARGAGAVNSNFTNANGLEDENHYTTALDMAMITRYALTVDGFRDVLGAEQYTMQPTNKQPERRNFGTAHHMIVYSQYEYKGAWGGKLGWTPQANHTAVTVAKRDGKELICVVMNSKTKWEKYKDTKKLFDYCFNNLQTVTVTAEVNKQRNIPVVEDAGVVGVAKVPKQTVTCTLYVPEGVTQESIDVSYNTKVSYHKGEQIAPAACFSIMSEGSGETPIYAMPLACEVEIDENPQSSVLSATEVMASADDVVKAPVSPRVPVIIASVVGGLLILFMLVRLGVQHYYRKKRARRRAMRYYR